MSLVSGTRIGAYEIVSLLGAGGMGEVYRAHDTMLRRDVALTLVPRVFADEPERRARLMREAWPRPSIIRTSARSTKLVRPPVKSTSRWNWSRGGRSVRD